ncbi:MAG TPA: MbnP family protein [Polyangiaceae bacterium]|nr:MbnP family protein [Polyangiaceae bacterium]
MQSRLLAVLRLSTAIFAGSFGCSSVDHGAAAAGGGEAGTGAGTASFAGESGVGGAGGVGTAGGVGMAGGVGGSPTDSACAEHPTPLRTQGTVLSLALAPVLAAKSFAFGQPNAMADGGSLVPLNFRFYVSDVQLLASSGEPLAVDLVTPMGEPEPYGVHLFNAEDDETSELRVLAPPGDYTGLRFALGIKLGCNQQSPAKLSEPLTDISQMTWPHTGGFLFLRYEGRYTAADGSSTTPSDVPPVVHMGGNIGQELVPHVTISGQFSLPESGVLEKKLSVVMDEVFKGATANIDVSDVAVGFLSTPEAVAGERLRRGLSDLHVFVLEP